MTFPWWELLKKRSICTSSKRDFSISSEGQPYPRKSRASGSLPGFWTVCLSFAEIRLGWVAVMNTEHRKCDLCNLLDNLMSKGSAPCHELTVIRGRLLFADNQYGKRSRQVFSVLSKACSRKKCVSIRGELLHALLNCSFKIGGLSEAALGVSVPAAGEADNLY